MPDRLPIAARRRTTARAAAVALAVGLAAAAAGCAAPEEAVTAQAAVPAAATSAAPDPPGRATPADGPVPVRTATPRPAEQPVAPTRLSYPRLGVDMATDPVGVADDATMQIPDDADVAGWYRFGSFPARGAGSTLLAAHVGTVDQPRGALHDLERARPGDEVALTDAEGAVHRYRVATVEHLRKESLDWLPYVARDGQERLVLVTCGGRWIPDLGAYDENVVVVALPIDPQRP